MNLDTFKLKKSRMNLLHCRFNVDGAIKTVLIAMCYKLFFETEQTHQPTHNTPLIHTSFTYSKLNMDEI